MNNSTYPNNAQEAIFVPVQKCPYHVTFDLDLDLEHTMDGDYLDTIVCKFGGDPATCPREVIGQHELSTLLHVTCYMLHCSVTDLQTN